MTKLKLVALALLLAFFAGGKVEAATPCIKHTFVSSAADSGDATKVGPAEWNECHTIDDDAISEGKLDFDPATQAELDAHDANAAAHSTGIAGNAATADALAANPTDCTQSASVLSYAYAIAANGDLTCATLVTIQALAPTADDDTGDGYIVGTKWIVSDGSEIYEAVDVTAATAVWRKTYPSTETQTFDIVADLDPKTTGRSSFATSLRVEGTTANSGAAIYQSDTTGLNINCYVAGVENDCDYYRQLNAGKAAGFKDSSGNVDFKYDEATGNTLFTKSVQIPVVDFATDVTTGTGKYYFRVPATLNGLILHPQGVSANVVTAGTTNATTFQITRCAAAATGNVCSGTTAAMLSTVGGIDSGENDTTTAAAPPVVDTANDDIATGQILRIDVIAVSTTPPKGLIVNLDFKLP